MAQQNPAPSAPPLWTLLTIAALAGFALGALVFRGSGPRPAPIPASSPAPENPPAAAAEPSAPQPETRPAGPAVQAFVPRRGGPAAALAVAKPATAPVVSGATAGKPAAAAPAFSAPVRVPAASGAAASAAPDAAALAPAVSGATAGKPAAGAVAARIGEQGRVLEQDLADFSAAESCYGPDAVASRKAGFMRMLEAAVMEEVLRRESGFALKDEDYAKEARRVDAQTRAPDILECVKERFGFVKGKGFSSPEGARRYERVFLRKYLIVAPFYRFLRFDPKVQGEVYARRDRILDAALKGAAFKELGAQFKIEYATKTYTLEAPKDASAPGPGSMGGWTPFEKQFIEDHLLALKPGRMKQAPIESDDDIRFVRLLGTDAGSYRFEWLVLKKREAGDYLGSIPKLRFELLDAEVKTWIKDVSGNLLVKTLSLD